MEELGDEKNVNTRNGTEAGKLINEKKESEKTAEKMQRSRTQRRT